MREVVLADDDFDIDAECVGRPKDLEDSSAGGAAGCGEVGDFDAVAMKAKMPYTFRPGVTTSR